MEKSLTIKEKAASLLKDIGFEAEVIVTKRGPAYVVNLSAETPALLIGREGETLQSIQHVLRLMLRGDIERDEALVVDVNGYKDKKAGIIEREAHAAATRVRESGKAEELGPYNSYERRIIHSAIGNIADVTSESKGEGAKKTVVITKTA